MRLQHRCNTAAIGDFYGYKCWLLLWGLDGADVGCTVAARITSYLHLCGCSRMGKVAMGAPQWAVAMRIKERCLYGSNSCCCVHFKGEATRMVIAALMENTIFW